MGTCNHEHCLENVTHTNKVLYGEEPAFRCLSSLHCMINNDNAHDGDNSIDHLSSDVMK